MPVETFRKSTNVRISSAAPISSTRALAISVTTSAPRALFCFSPVPDRPLVSFNVELRSGFEICKAGKSPNRIPVKNAIPTVNAITRQSSSENADAPLRSPMRGTSPGLNVSSNRTPQVPATKPRIPPAVESTMLSVKSCRMIRPRLAPIAARIANSFCRADVRASDQQHEADGAHQNEQGRPDIPRHLLLHRDHRYSLVRVHYFRVLAAI